ncbi:hypothetical protein F52700_11554 [Fusarium sp. NRRL 52700]|nr:hypothetical protein F52700_11554 [Fusarium sp. NRRL 52700]
MADPLSIASGVAGLVSLGLTLCGGLSNYFNVVKGRHQDIEIAGQSLALLESNLFIIQSSTLKLGHRHALSADGVNRGLANCKSQLVTLQQMMLDLTRDEGLSDIKGKLKRQMTIVRYPFDQKRLTQLQDQLSRANATLESFVQNFNLDINIGISEDLRILKTYTNANDNITHTMLATIARQLDSIGHSVQRTEMDVVTMSGRVQESPLAGLTTGSHLYDKTVKPRYLQNAQREERMVKRLNDPQCSCSDPTPRSIHQELSYIDRSWGGWIISKAEHKRQRHRPGCIFFSRSLQTSKTTFTFLGLRYWICRSLSMSLTREHPAGAYRLSFGIQPCNIVESSPAFEAFHDFENKYINEREQYKRVDLREETSILINKLRSIYRSGNASPWDVDDNGNNTAHISMSCHQLYRRQIIYLLPRAEVSFEDVLMSIRSLLSFMFDIGVPIGASNFCQQIILQDLWYGDSLMMLHSLYNFIATLDTSFHGVDVAHCETRSSGSTDPLDSDLSLWGVYPDIAEANGCGLAFGFNDIFRAVMQRDLNMLEALIKGDQLPPGILETDMYGRNIFHASITWPEGLGTLLQHSQAVSLLVDDESISSKIGTE